MVKLTDICLAEKKSDWLSPSGCLFLSNCAIQAARPVLASIPVEVEVKVLDNWGALIIPLDLTIY